MLTSAAVHAGSSEGTLRLACIGQPGMEVGSLRALCRAVGAGMAGILEREIEVVEGGAADVALLVARLDKRLVRVRLHWSGAEPGPEVGLGSADAALTERSYESLATGLLAVSPPP